MGTAKTIDDILSSSNIAWTGEELRRHLDEAGFVVVPKEPTEVMLSSAVRYGDSDGYGSIGELDAKCAWEDMIAAWLGG